MNSLIDVSFINDYPSMLEGLIDLTKLSKGQIKKYLTTKSLNKPIKKQRSYDVPINLLNKGKINPIYRGEVIKTLFEDENFLVLSKPVKIHCHPLDYDENNNLLSYLSSIAPELLTINSDQMDRGLIYRLDFETSGLIYYAKNDEVYEDMRENFNQMLKKKRYLAVVCGKAKQTDELNDKLISFGPKKAKVKVDKEKGKLCHITYELIKYDEKKDLSLIEVSLHEGFRHQIRVQLANVNLPILGDPLYGNSEHSKMMLHCYQYVFSYEGKTYDVKDKWKSTI